MGSRRIVGFAVGEHRDADLAQAGLQMAVAVRGGKDAIAGVILHTDQGSEHTAKTFQAACGRVGIKQSMGRVGSAADNAVIGSWHSTLEFELRQLEHFTTKAQARVRVAAWIEEYNHDRRRSSLGMLPQSHTNCGLPSSGAMSRRPQHERTAPDRPAWRRPRRHQGHALRVGSGWPPASLDPGSGRRSRDRDRENDPVRHPTNSGLYGFRGLPLPTNTSPATPAWCWRS